CQRYSYSHFTF
nr:immunoglobulin light chain junction region [Macaca mulatta]MOW44476.1 immunoglobulin light chain junction region [Macaca mulatta]MOW45181.1 immunoglobulin light chain junction region [Macaca mulatta]MOW45248.1 immunoglobulin light chain junction region [Macaca mulatta]